MAIAAVTPWWQALKIRPEIVSASGQIDDVRMSLYQAVHGTGSTRPPYADAAYYGEITFPTDLLVDLLSEIAIRLGGGPGEYTKARALTRLDQGMGGGKSHACIGSYLLASNPRAFAGTELGQAIYDAARTRLGQPLPTDLNDPHVVVLACDNMTPGAPDPRLDGPAAKTLYERFLWRLFSGDFTLYSRYKDAFNSKANIAEALAAIHRPILIVIDEVMNYLGNASDGDEVMAGQDLEFLRALLDTLDTVPNVAALVVMISSDDDPMAQSAAAAARRADLDSVLGRNGPRQTVVANSDFTEILRRRLFDQAPVPEVVSATAAKFAPTLADATWTKHVWDNITAPWRKDFPAAAARSYPFHPQLMHLAETEWAAVSGFQRVRSTIRIFAATVYSLQQRGRSGQWAPLLIGPGDLPLSDNNVREAILGSGLVEDDRTIGNYRSLVENEIVTADEQAGAARRLDLERESILWAETNPRAAERAATFIFLTSIVGTRLGGKRGASAPEAKSVTAVPDNRYSYADADAVLDDLVSPERGMTAVDITPGQGNNRPARYHLSTRLTYRMLVNNIRKSITPEERDAVLAKFAEDLSNTGPFNKRLFVKALPERTPSEVLGAAGIDDARTTRLVVLDPAQFSLRNGMEKDTIAALTAVMGLGGGADTHTVQWASSAVYAVVNTQRRSQARTIAAEYLARQRALDTSEVQADAELKETGTQELADAKDRLTKAVKRAYQHVVFLAQPDPQGERHLQQIAFESDNESALDGTQVWKALVVASKALDVKQLTWNSLLFNLREDDYVKPLSEVRDAFWNAPRLPLLHGGEPELRQAIWECVNRGELTINDTAGQPVAVTGADQINLNAVDRVLAKPAPAAESNTDTTSTGQHGAGGGTTGTASGAQQDPQGNGGSPTAAGPGSTASTDPPAEKSIQVTLPGTLIGQAEKSDGLAQVFRALYTIMEDNASTFAAGTIQLVVSAETSGPLIEAIEELGLRAIIKDQ